MKNNINEEIENVKYLMGYKRSLTLNENIVSASGIVDEEVLKKIEEFVNQLCKTTPNTCRACGDLMKILPTGQLKEKQMEACLGCENKQGQAYVDCNKMKGFITNTSMQFAREFRDMDKVQRTSDRATLISSLLLSLTTLYTNLKEFFTKQQPQQ